VKLRKLPCSCGCRKFIIPGLIGCQCGSLYENEADELIRRWNAFEPGGEVESLQKQADEGSRLKFPDTTGS
jgi:hypothetical protein